MCELNSVSIIVPAFNEEQHIKQCLDSLFALNSNNLKIEVIVIDNGSTDNTAEIAQHCGATVKIQPYVNVSALRNLGASISGGNLLAFVDADCVVDHDWLSNAIKCIYRESADAVGSFHDIPEESGWIGEISTLIQSRKVGADINYIPSGNMIIRRAAFEDIGGFDSSLETGEDVDICKRLKDKGYKIFSDPAIHSIHYGSPKNIKEMFRREMWHGRTMWVIFLRDFPRNNKWLLFLYVNCNALLIMLMIVGLVRIAQGSITLLLASCFLYLCLNLLVALQDWLRVRKSFLGLYGYVLVYGAARAVGMFEQILSKMFFVQRSFIEKEK